MARLRNITPMVHNLAGSWSVYEDVGCSVNLADGTTHVVSPKCLECPLPQCIEDNIEVANKFRKDVLMAKRMKELGVNSIPDLHTKAGIEKLAELSGCTTRTAFRRVRLMEQYQFELGQVA